MLKIQKVTKKFGALTAVKDLDLVVQAGEIVGLIGENGSGKTTTLKMIAGLYQPNSGQITVNGFNVVAENEKTRQLIGYIPDEPAVYDKLTGEELLHFIAQAFEVPKDLYERRVKELKELFPMENQTSGYFEDYSRGTKQKFLIIAALLHQPPLLLIDEPIVGLDPISVATAIKVFNDYIKEKDHAILLCTHSLSVAEKICHRYAIIKQGSIIASGTLDQLKSQTKLPQGSLQDVYLKINS